MFLHVLHHKAKISYVHKVHYYLPSVSPSSLDIMMVPVKINRVKPHFKVISITLIELI